MSLKSPWFYRAVLVFGAVTMISVTALPARADFFDDARHTFEIDIPHFFQDDVPCAFGGKPTSGTRTSCKSPESAKPGAPRKRNAGAAIGHFFQTDVPHFFQDDIPCAFGGKPTSGTRTSCKSSPDAKRAPRKRNADAAIQKEKLKGPGTPSRSPR